MLALFACLVAQLPTSTQVSEPTSLPNTQELIHHEFGSLLTHNHVFTLELVVQEPSTPGAAAVRTVCRDLTGQICWERLYQGTLTGSQFTEAITDHLVYSEADGLLIQSTPLSESEPIATSQIQALDATTGALVWSTALSAPPQGVGVLDLKFDSQRNQVLAVIQDYAGGGPGITALDASTGIRKWDAITDVFAFQPLVFDWDFAESSDTLFAAFGGGDILSPTRLSLYAIGLKDGSLRDLTEFDELGQTLALSAAPQGGSVAVAIGRTPSARLFLVDEVSGQVLWTTPVPDAPEWEKPCVAFEPDGQAILAGFQRRGVVGSPTQTPSSRFLRVSASNGQILWVDTDVGLQGTFAGSARGPHLLDLNDQDHLRSYTRYLALNKHVQVRQRIRNSDGAVLASDVADGSGSGALHWQELGVDPFGQAWSLVQIPLPLQVPSLFFPSVALASWPVDLSGAYSFDFLALEGQVQEYVLSVAGSPGGSYSAAVTRWEQGATRLAVTDSHTGASLFSTELPDQGGGERYLTRYSPDERTVAVRGQAYSQLSGASVTNELTVLDAQTGTVLWSRDVPPPLSSSLENVEWPDAGQAAVALSDTQIFSSEGGLGLVGQLEASDLLTGALQWSASMSGYGVTPFPIALEEAGVFIVSAGPTGSEEPLLLRLNAQSGAPEAQFGLGMGSEAHALATNGSQVAVAYRRDTGQDRVVVLDLDLTAVQYAEDVNFDFESPALVALTPEDGFILVDDDSVRQVGDRPQPGEPTAASNWARPGSLIDPALNGSRHYFTTDGGATLMGIRYSEFIEEIEAVALDTQSGQTLWEDSDLLLTGMPATGTTLFSARGHGTGENGFRLWANLPLIQDLEESGLPTITQYRSYELPDVILAPDELSLASGGTADLWIRGEAKGDDPSQPIYFLVAASELVDPGTSIGSVELPFSLDDPFVAFSLSPFQTLFTGLVGDLDHLGNARAQLDLPPGLPSDLAGATFYFAWVQFEVNSVSGVLEATFASDPAVLTLAE